MRYRAMRPKLTDSRLFCAATDVVNHASAPICGAWARNNPDVRKPRIQKPGNRVSIFKRQWKRIASHWSRSNPQAGPRTREIGLQVQHSPVVDACVRSILTPGLARRIIVEMLQHVFMHEPLQVQSQCVTGGANHNVSTNACGARYVTVGVGNRGPGRIVAGGHADLRSGCRSETFSVRNRCCCQPAEDGPNREA